MRKTFAYLFILILSCGFLSAQSDYEKAFQHLIDKEYTQALLLYENVINNSKDTFILAVSHNNTGEIYLKQGIFSEAVNHYNKSDSLFSLININSKYRAHIANNLGIIQKQKGNYYLAIKHYEFGITIAKHHNDKLQLSKLYNNLGNVHFSLREYNRALEYFKKALKIRDDSYTVPMINMAEIYYRKGMKDSSRIYFEKAFRDSNDNISTEYLERRIKYAAVLLPPKSKKIIENVKSGIDSLHHEFSKMRVYFQLAKYYLELNDLDKSINYFSSCIEYLEDLNQDNTYLVRSLTQRAYAFLNSGDLQRALSDFNQADQLINEFNRFALDPESMILFAHAEQDNFDGLINCLFQLYETSGDINYMHQAVFISANNKARELKNQKNNYTSANKFMDDLMNNVPPDITILDYIITSKNIYALIINRENIQFKQLAKPGNWDLLLEDYFNVLINSDHNADYRMLLVNYLQLGSSIYQSIIDPVKLDLKPRIKIIPDEELFYIPFGGIPFPGQSPDRFTDVHTLLHQHAISYDYSISSYIAAVDNKTGNKFTVFMPEYEISNLYDSTHIADLQKLFIRKKFYEKQEATKSAFLSSNPSGTILLSMHGEVDPVNPNNSRLIFNDSTLYNYQIPTKNYNNTMMVLSACETGQGKIYKSSGSQSLGKTFRSYGATVLMANFKLDKHTSHHILMHYFKNQKSGLSKDIALQKAKLKYLEECFSFQERPYYWQAMVIYGNEGPVRKNIFLWIFAGVVLIAAISSFLYRRS